MNDKLAVTIWNYKGGVGKSTIAIMDDTVKAALQFADIVLVPVLPDFNSINNLRSSFNFIMSCGVGQNQIAIIKNSMNKYKISAEAERALSIQGFKSAGSCLIAISLSVISRLATLGINSCVLICANHSQLFTLTFGTHSETCSMAIFITYGGTNHAGTQRKS